MKSEGSLELALETKKTRKIDNNNIFTHLVQTCIIVFMDVLGLDI